MTRRYKIAGKVVEVTSMHNMVHDYCADYVTEDPADYSVVTTQADVEYERAKNKSETEFEGGQLVEYPDDYLEELAVYRKIARKMLEYDVLLFHGSVIAVDGEGYLFTAKSGTGKSTHTRLWRKYLGERAVMVNDDKPLLGIQDDHVIAYGTPYNGKHRLGANISVPLKAICILTRDTENHVERITKGQAYAILLQQAYRPVDEAGMRMVLTLLDALTERVKLYRLGCNMDIEAAKVAYEGMR
ncbi:MAG: hypothetical protein IK081_12675 [Lachnospiraceae bacterium]|nr:hypothetical protein [Lachnospiraceae bacterium]